MKNCLIIGCGYLGAAVAEVWAAAKYKVNVVTRSRENAKRFSRLGYHALVADITDRQTLQCIQDSYDVVLFAVGFDRTVYRDIRDVYVDGLQNVLQLLSGTTKQLIYISSTGVYGNHDGRWVTEETPASPIRPGGKACLEAEQLIRNSALGARSTILRLAGIYGPGRVPRLKAISDQDWSQLSPDGCVNLIHNYDAANIVDLVARQEIVDQTYLVADGNPAPRREFYEYIAEQLEQSPIDWSAGSHAEARGRAAADKKISNQKLVNQTQYRFQFPDFRSGIRHSISQTQ